MPENGARGETPVPLAPFLDDADERVRIATRAASIGIWDWDIDTGIMHYSQVAREICGLPNEQVITRETARTVTHPEDLPTTSALAKRALDPAIREKAVYRYRIVRADDSEVRWVVAYGEAQFDEKTSRALRYVGTIQDITDQKLAEDALIESEARLRLALDAAQMAVWEVDLQSGTVVGSPELNRLCGFPEDAAPTLEELRSRYAPGEQERLQEEGARMVARGDRHFQTEFRQIWPDGTEKWLLLRAQVAPTSSGPGQRVIGVLMDVTERKRAEERLATVAKELRHRVKNSLAVVSALAASTFRPKADIDQALAVFQGRLSAFAAATDLMSASENTELVALDKLVEAIVAPFRPAAREAFVVTGDRLELPTKLSTSIAMALHELCTNALKYGSLSSDGGEVNIRWSRSGDALLVEWQERGGPELIAPTNLGYGTRLLTRGLFDAPSTVELTYAPTGLMCRIVLRRGHPVPTATIPTASDRT